MKFERGTVGEGLFSPGLRRTLLDMYPGSCYAAPCGEEFGSDVEELEARVQHLEAKIEEWVKRLDEAESRWVMEGEWLDIEEEMRKEIN